MTKLTKLPTDNINEYTLKRNRTLVKSDVPTDTIVNIITTILDANKAEDITIVDLTGKSDIAECMIIATGRSDRHIKACADILCLELRNKDIQFATEGMEHKNWVLVDTVTVIVHIFNKETRDLYNLEDLWK
jgi:ribosome-associated protein